MHAPIRREQGGQPAQNPANVIVGHMMQKTVHENRIERPERRQIRLREIGLDEFAESAGIIPHELLVRLGNRAPRVYLRDGAPVRAASLAEQPA